MLMKLLAALNLERSFEWTEFDLNLEKSRILNPEFRISPSGNAPNSNGLKIKAIQSGSLEVQCGARLGNQPASEARRPML